ncbi:MAG: hypothetical protein ACYCWW_14160 [Deltaproteobacteria bacterium]
MNGNLAGLVLQATKVLGMNQRDLATFLGVSVRTVQRHAYAGGIGYPSEYEKLLRALYPKDPALAGQIAHAIGRDLTAMGISPPPQPAPAPQPAPLPPRPAVRPEHVDAVLCAAADAIGVLPRDARPMVAAIFARVRDLGPLDVDALVARLADGPSATSKKPRA